MLTWMWEPVELPFPSPLPSLLSSTTRLFSFLVRVPYSHTHTEREREMARTVQVSDPGIRLFGKTIHEFGLRTICHEGASAGADGDTASVISPATKKLPDDPSVSRILKLKIPEDKTCSKEGAEVVEVVDDSSSASRREDVVSEIIPPSSVDGVPICDTNIEESEKPTANSDGKAADGKVSKDLADKKQQREKLIPCPRCNSAETKFCYFNNYNVNQPRHFCKKCQRYWTAGGSVRNIPVGAGRRKSKRVERNNEEKESHSENLCESSSSSAVLTTMSDPTMADMNWMTVNYPSSGNLLPWTYCTVQPTDYWFDMRNGSVANFSVCGSGNLGKHSRDDAPLQRSLSEECVSKVDDTKKMGLKMGQAVEASNSGSFFKMINSRTHWEVRNTEFSKILCANPAALSRSMDFRECS